MWHTGLVAPRHVGSSRTRARTRVPCIGRQMLNHCATGETLGILARGLIVAGEGPVRVCLGKWSGAGGGVLPAGDLQSSWVSPWYQTCCRIGAVLPFPTVQPDPPVNVTVTAVDRNPRWLSVTWQDPPSWNSYFYRLQFELRYRAERSKTFTMWMVNFSFTSGQKRAPRYSGVVERVLERKKMSSGSWSATHYLHGLE